jgi:hypothetical protein
MRGKLMSERETTEQVRDKLRGARQTGSPVLLAYSRIRKSSGYWVFILTRRGVKKTKVRTLAGPDVSFVHEVLDEIFLAAEAHGVTGLRLTVAADVDPVKLASAIWNLNRGFGMTDAVVDFGNGITVEIRDTEKQADKILVAMIRRAQYDARFNTPEAKLARLTTDRERLASALAALQAHLAGCTAASPEGLSAIWTTSDPTTGQVTLHVHLDNLTVTLADDPADKR